MEYILLVLVLITAIPVVFFSLEIFASLFNQNKAFFFNKLEPEFIVLIPAHNESGTIRDTLLNLKKHMPRYGKILVVADNCTDDTASEARCLDVDVIERNDHVNRGKGFALNYGIEVHHLRLLLL